MDPSALTESPAYAEVATSEAANPWKRAFNRIFTRHLMNIAVLMVLPVIFLMTLNPTLQCVQDPDIWWHLANARLLTSTHHFIWTEPYSFTVAGERWINPEWLSELPYWFSYQALHLRGIYLVNWLGLCANLIFMYWRAYRRSGHAGAAWWAAGLGFVLISINSGPRTIAIAYLALSAEMALLESADRGNTRSLWLLPPLFCVWINLHGSWLIGLALFVLYILCGVFGFKKGNIEQEPFTPSQRNRLLAILGLCMVVLLINPYGWRLVWNPIDMMFNQKLNIANVAEWKPLNLSTVVGAAGFATMCLMVFCNAIRGRKWRIYELALVFFAWYAAIDHMRFLFMAAVLVIPLIADDIRRGANLGSDQKTIPVANAFMVATVAVVILLIFPKEKKLEAKMPTFFPMQILDSIQPSWRTFTNDPMGGMMTFKSKPDFLDTRLDTFEHHGVLSAYLQAMYVIRTLEVFDQYRVDHVLVTDDMPVAYLLKRTPGWTIVQQEKTGKDLYVLFARTPGAPAGSSTKDALLPAKK
jgi:hypothetical protein